MPRSPRPLALVALVACSGAAARAPSAEETSPFAPIAPPMVESATVEWDGGDVCAFAPDVPPPPCERRHRFGRPNRIYVGEIDALERLLAATPVSSPDHAAILQRLASDYLDLACIAFSECVRGSASGRITRQTVQAGDTTRAAHTKLRASCERLQQDHPDAPDFELCR